MSRPDRILILTASAGAGHVIAAQALEQAFRAADPTAAVRCVDVLEVAGRVFRGMYGGGYLALIRHFPTGMGWLYDALDRPPGRLSERLRLAIQDAFCGPVVRFLRAEHPRLIVNTHFLSAEIVAQLRRAGRLAARQVTVCTDFETHRLWVNEPTERYYVATDVGKAYLTTWGVPAAAVRVTGIPVRPAFTTPLPLAEARRRCGVNPDQPLVLLLCGGFGVGPVGELLRELVRMPAAGQIVAIVGRNEPLRRRLAELAHGARRPVTVVGFTDRMHEFMFAADLVVTKPGGLTVSEALACGLPLVIVNPIPGQETRNADWLLEHGAAVKVNHPRLLGYRVATLLGDPARLATLRAAARGAGRPQAGAEIARDALALG